MNLGQNTFSNPFNIFDFLPSQRSLEMAKDESDAAAINQFGSDPNPIRRVPFNLLTGMGVNPTVAKGLPSLLDVAPVTGDASLIADAVIAAKEGDLPTAGLLSAMAILPAVKGKNLKSLLKTTEETTPLLFNNLSPQVDPTKTGFIFKGISRPDLSKSENRFFNNGFGQKEAILPIRSMNASQDKVNPDFTITESSSGELPLVIKKGNELFVSDGHHRLTKLAVQGEQNAKVRLVDFDEPTTTPLLDYDPQGSAKNRALLEELGIESPNEGLLKRDRTEEIANLKSLLKTNKLNASGDVVVGDVVTFKQDVFGGSFKNPKKIGERIIKGEVVKDSYGANKQQHTFTIKPIEVSGDNASEIMDKETFLIKGRNLYRHGVDREEWADETARKIVANEKHKRGDRARLERKIRKEGSSSQTIQQNQEILKPIGQKVTHPKFGNGEVISHDKAEGSSIINVKFNDGKIIRIDNNYVSKAD